MSDGRQFYAGHVYAMGFWVAGFSLVILDLLQPLETGELGVLLAGIGGLLNIKEFIRYHCEGREHNAFELGRDSVRSIQSHDHR